MMSTVKARLCVKYVMTLVGSIPGEQALDMLEAFERILETGETPEVTPTQVTAKGGKRRYNGRVYLNDHEKIEAVAMIDRGFRPREVASKFRCSSRQFTGKNLDKLRLTVNGLTQQAS